ncbi:uncharacterized protein LOC136032864 [Artemia franciscana]|uniref:uncharacterized protein LOC136032864 n=1 Tax=Artemia franciscana TaxID=6661 RepID=UPI0032DA51B5
MSRKIIYIVFTLVGYVNCQYKQLVAFSYAKAKPASQPGFLSFSKQLVNIDACFKPEFGVFIALDDGIYAFSFNIVSKNEPTRVSLMKNREPLATAFADRGGYNSASQFVIVKLFYNDTIYLRVEEGEIYESSTRERAFTTFSGYLILPIPDQTIQEGSFQGTVVERPFNIPAFQQGYPIRPFPAYGNPGSVSQQQPFRPSQWGPFLKYHPSQSRVSFPKEQKEENAVKTEVSDSIWPFEGAVIIDDEKTDFYLQSISKGRKDSAFESQTNLNLQSEIPNYVIKPCSNTNSDGQGSTLPGKIGKPCS